MRIIPVALIQFDAVPEHIEENLDRMEHLAEMAVEAGARWVMFHEGTVCDYTPRVADFAEPVPDGKSTQRMVKVAKRLGCYISFGVTEREDERFYITQVFVDRGGLVHAYRKSWLWRQPDDDGYRHEWARYDTGTGPELFAFDGVQATCFICADGEAPRRIERAAMLNPQVVFYPNN
ncbi:MAG: carbon-nitrogen hydrolase family protein, partial [Planctomycetia bacterium]|nr:carbon-nitrogen hydrolase family protein [Planctomycetia bacterium]